MFEAVVARLRMRPMSLHETGHSTGTISLKALLASSLGPCSDTGLTIQDVATRVAVGGRPATLAVIVAAGYGYVRPDGVAVVPIGALAP